MLKICIYPLQYTLSTFRVQTGTVNIQQQKLLAHFVQKFEEFDPIDIRMSEKENPPRSWKIILEVYMCSEICRLVRM